MSENGPREGTRDLPRRDPEAGARSIESDSPAGRAYDTHAREESRRRQEILALSHEGVSREEIPGRFARDHPAERPLSRAEVDEVLGLWEASRNGGRRAGRPERAAPDRGASRSEEGGVEP